MKNYIGTDKEIELNGRKYKAFFPDEHSTIEGIVLVGLNANVYDDRPGVRPHYIRHFYILWKTKKRSATHEWKMITADDPDYKWVTTNDGLFKVLFELEDDETRTRILSVQRVKELKKEIPEAKQRLSNLVREYQMFTGKDFK